MKLNIYNWQQFKKYFPKVPYSQSFLTTILVKVFSEYDVETLNIVFVSKAKIKSLNKKYRNKAKSTDVLSFLIEENPMFGEVYVCPEYIAVTYGPDEVIRTIIHGILHILGKDHKENFNEDSKQKEEMFVKQENILQNIMYEINNRSRKSR